MFAVFAGTALLATFVILWAVAALADHDYAQERQIAASRAAVAAHRYQAKAVVRENASRG
jgi:hypothetical protein